MKIAPELVVVVLGARGHHAHHAVRVEGYDEPNGQADVFVGARKYTIRSRSKLGDIRVVGNCNGQPFTAQIERGPAAQPLAIRLAHNAAQIDALVLLPRAAELFKLMPYKAPPDLSRFLLSPMPGLLVDLVVEEGQRVRAGDKLAVIEAMKMENTLVATQDGTVAELLAAKGESLAVDQAIVRFE